MHGPPLAGWLLVALGAATGAYGLFRLRHAPPGQRCAAGSEALMGWGMAAMAVPADTWDPSPWGPPLYAVVFGVAALAALSPVRAGGRVRSHPHHAVEALTMAYMAVAMVGHGPGGHPGHPGGAGAADRPGQAAHSAGPEMSGGPPLLTGLLLLYFAAYAIRCGLRLLPVAPTAAGGGPAGWSRRPELVDACRLATATGMCAMLLTL